MHDYSFAVYITTDNKLEDYSLPPIDNIVKAGIQVLGLEHLYACHETDFVDSMEV